MTGSTGATAVGPRLSLMMFTQYAVWGAWLPVVGRYLGEGLNFSPGQIGMIVGTAGAVGAVSAPFLGQIADRYFSAERVMFVLMLLGSVVMYVMAGQDSYGAWLGLAILYSVIFMPTLGISNSIAFAHLRDPEKHFPAIRVWGTIGWIVVSWVFPMVWLQTGLKPQAMPPFLVGDEYPNVVERLADALRLSAILGGIYAFICLLVLPHTPPKKHAESIALTKAFGLLRNRGMLVIAVVALPISVIHMFYFIQTPQFLPTLAGVRDADITPAMTIGQFSEIFVLAILGLLIKRIGFRWTLAIGMLAYFARYAIFALGAPTWFVITSQALHGLCYGCFFAGAFIYVERIAPADIRHSAQTAFGIVILGLGPIVAGPAVGFLAEYATQETTIQAASDRVNLIPKQPADGWDSLYPGAAADMSAYGDANPNDRAASWKGLRPDTEVSAMNYTKFWWVCGIIGLASAVVLIVLFKLDPPAAGQEEVPGEPEEEVAIP